jgi:hypothetical protein
MSPGDGNKLTRYLAAGILCSIIYVALYTFATRVLAHEIERANGQVHYTFFRDRLETEHSLVLFFAPLIYVDEALSGRKHRFDIDYL